MTRIKIKYYIFFQTNLAVNGGETCWTCTVPHLHSNTLFQQNRELNILGAHYWKYTHELSPHPTHSPNSIYCAWAWLRQAAALSERDWFFFFSSSSWRAELRETFPNMNQLLQPAWLFIWLLCKRKRYWKRHKCESAAVKILFWLETIFHIWLPSD